MAIETGVDIVEIDRVADLVRRYGERFGRRVFTSDEWSRFHDQPASLAARFAAKEAVIKALGSPQMALHEIEVARPAGERPRIALSGRARQRAEALGVQSIALSLSHARAFAVAVVVLER
ncbi:MAG TPA: holo-ACP synthase [Chloroflexota bacterium]|jgi:holo-[acyl-carrier protein] synthase|nr:holo-ACP synthase [Chloroflexota bacterium]